MCDTARVLKAIQTGDRDSVSSLIAGEPALAAARDDTGVSMLMWACYYRQPEIIRILRAGLSDLDVFEAAALGDIEQLRAECESDQSKASAWSVDGFQPVHLASFFAQLDAIKFLTGVGVDVNTPAQNPSGVRPIHSAAASRNGEAVRLLLEAGADPNVRQQGGWSPLHSAALHGDIQMARLLLKHGADAGLKSDDGKRPIDMAAETNHPEMVQLLRQ
jgi:uncharacterized protein